MRLFPRPSHLKELTPKPHFGETSLARQQNFQIRTRVPLNDIAPATAFRPLGAQRFGPPIDAERAPPAPGSLNEKQMNLRAP